jgi:subtilisin family serine protease
MKQLFIVFIVAISFTIKSQDSQKTDLSSFSKAKINWHNKDFKTDKIAGTSVEKLYTELIKDKKPKKSIIVAIIDGGVDINHVDLKENIWINKKELAENGIDDDKNGYIDDVNGWNFLGNSKGENIVNAPLEKTRIFGILDKKYSSKTENDVPESDKKEYQLYLKVKQSFNKEYQNALAENNSIKEFISNIGLAEAYMRNYLKKDEITLSDLKAIKTNDAELKSINDFLKSIYSSNFDIKEVENYNKHLETEIKYHLNVDFNPRKDIIGDDCENYNQIYGNNDVIGKEPSHGTFGAGIIASKRNNNIGIDGVADSVKLMVLRVVPDGDEYDKDVALSIKYAVDNGANIINMSFGKEFSVNPKKVWEAIKYASDRNVLLVHAAGNESENNDTIIHYPSKFVENTDTVVNFIAVGASDMKNDKNLPASFSNYGKKNVDVFAPGYELVSTAPKNTYSLASGTSFSTPLVAGIAALIWSYFPQLTATELKNEILSDVQYFGKQKVYIPSDGYEKKTKTEFKNLSVSGGIINAYNIYLHLSMTNK